MTREAGRGRAGLALGCDVLAEPRAFLFGLFACQSEGQWGPVVLDEKSLCVCPADGRDLVSKHPLGSEGSSTPSGLGETPEPKLTLWARRGPWRVGCRREVMSVEGDGLRRLESAGGQIGAPAHQTPCGLRAECWGCRPGTGHHLGPRLWE